MACYKVSTYDVSQQRDEWFNLKQDIRNRKEEILTVSSRMQNLLRSNSGFENCLGLTRE